MVKKFIIIITIFQNICPSDASLAVYVVPDVKAEIFGCWLNNLSADTTGTELAQEFIKTYGNLSKNEKRVIARAARCNLVNINEDEFNLNNAEELLQENCILKSKMFEQASKDYVFIYRTLNGPEYKTYLTQFLKKLMTFGY